MSFWGCKFTFDGISCEEYELMIYNIGKDSQDETKFAHTVTVQEERVGNHWRPLFFGVTYENKLECEMVFGVNQERIDDHQFMSRQEMAKISSWLAGHQEYKWLEIEQDDLTDIRYKCMVTKLEAVEYGGLPWGFRATFTCDGPYAYMLPRDYVYEVNGELDIEFDNLSDHNGLYSPLMIISATSVILTDDGDRVLTDEDDKVLITGGTFSVENRDTNSVMRFSNIPEHISYIRIDNEHCVITSNTNDNLYKCFNFSFLRLKRGKNMLHFSGYGVVTIRCEFPVSVGM